MKRCRELAQVGRRQFLRGAVAAAAAVPAVAFLPEKAKGAGAGRGDHPSRQLAKVAALKPNEPFEVSYPDGDAPGVLLKLGKKVQGGAGPDGDIVGFTTLCPHKGIPLAYSADDQSFPSPAHYSRFDAEKGGLEIWGHATQNLPQYVLRIDGNGDIY